MLKVERNYGKQDFNELFDKYLEQKTKYLKISLTRDEKERYNKEYCSSTQRENGVDKK